ncbi:MULTISPECIES: chemotaxis protein CheW [unclassified Okeania]|uniref:chemotaxis protein CheW n=1 Tax=unclassified Okeania TaxID=2634635 RepID=UPI0013BF6018|nr:MULTISPECIES: CheW domain-containing protein [unclassified Okeania]NEN92124.1 chemotaxis protein CheW [Okeania sp. SIO3H1]NET29493.1 chemotaxis protein CheW [Okeania sp. SIO1I7]NET43428.1 chemotaxis protein CheW [Okeania sp. SIO2B3]
MQKQQLFRNTQYLCIEIDRTLQTILSTDDLDEVITLDYRQILQIPGMPAVVTGVFQWHGEIMWLIDIAYLMGFNPLLSTGYNQEKFRVVKVKYKDNYLGILVQKVGELINIETKNITLLKQKKVNSPVEKFIKGTCTNSAGEKMMIVDITKIIQYLEKAEK